MLYICYTPSGCFGAVPWLIQNLNPDDLEVDLMVAHEPEIVTQMPFIVKGLDL